MAQVGSESLSRTGWKKQNTAARKLKIFVISVSYRRRTFSEQSGGLENMGLRETKIDRFAIPAVRSFSQRSPQILGILGAQLSERELCPRAKWRRKRAWQPTLSVINPLISLRNTHAPRITHIMESGITACLPAWRQHAPVHVTHVRRAGCMSTCAA